ncbi:isochorismatase family protein [Celerinatantimonas diazotrophica]|uniref:nicotinamidase n=1 Tax=Celerinatantimonas diazotrophica TaxID=412034 RepID=A0A4R1JAL0_9GAMM|nr:isochorismatase family protein [Celerinatantimonas diazotrophica]TCK47534.1 nicotinamidase/pyrazinamidase [Celerinatantimonas diazotrophica]CAG9296848.1 Nicotinamidase [Celerinatantimonas diazotrophica]
MATQPATITVKASDALLIIDLQNDFLPGGALGIPSSYQVIEPINRYTQYFERSQATIILSRDWHPEEHCSFIQQNGPWPPHCIQNTQGAQISADFAWPTQAWLVSKATSVEKDAYSAFDGTELSVQMKHCGIKRLFICGLATDYCVLQSTLDALANGFECYLLTDGIDAVNVNEHDGQQAIEKMCAHGATPIQWQTLAPLAHS